MVSEREHYARLTGDYGETTVFEILRGMGLSPKWGGMADLEIRDTSVEVKTSHLTRYRSDGRAGYQFCLRRDGHCKLRADVLVLVCITKNGNDFFIIPAAKVGNKRKIAIPREDPRSYRGQWSRYLDRWDIVETQREVGQCGNGSKTLAR